MRTVTYFIKEKDMETPKELLAPVVRARLLEHYGSIADAAEHLPTESYERLRKSLQRNSFGAGLLEAVFPDQELSDLRKQYSFRVGRANKGRGSDPDLANRQMRRYVMGELVGDEDAIFLRENKLFRDRISLLIREECARIRSSFK